jgi:hypothetical protein
MRENRTYGSEGGEGQPFPTPIGTQGQGLRGLHLWLWVPGLGLSRSPGMTSFVVAGCGPSGSRALRTTWALGRSP